MKANINRKMYEVWINSEVYAPVWWQSAREAQDIPMAMLPLLQCTDDSTTLTWDDLQWCKSLPHWDGIDGWPLRVWRVQ